MKQRKSVRDSSVFSKDDTYIVKGIAIIAMVFHHTWKNIPELSIFMLDKPDLVTVLAEAAKICVALLTILSAYGLSESYKRITDRSVKNDIFFFLQHYLQLMSLYWVILLWGYIVTIFQCRPVVSIYGGIFSFTMDFLGLAMITGTPCFAGGWYLTAIIIMYAFFPVLFRMIERFRFIILIISFSPWVYYLYRTVFLGQMIDTDRTLYYFFSFSIGVLLSQTGVLSAVRTKGDDIKTGILSFVFVIISLIIRSVITLPADPLLAMAVIVFEVVVISRHNRVSAFLKCFGENSANIWLLHGFVIDIVYEVKFINYPAYFIFLLFICLAISMQIELIKTATGYKQYVRQLRNRWFPINMDMYNIG